MTNSQLLFQVLWVIMPALILNLPAGAEGSKEVQWKETETASSNCFCLTLAKETRNLAEVK